MVYCTKRWNWETDIQLLGIKNTHSSNLVNSTGYKPNNLSVQHQQKREQETESKQGVEPNDRKSTTSHKA